MGNRERFAAASRYLLIALGALWMIVVFVSASQIENPAKPKHGTIVLEVERILKINPYDFPDFGMRGFSFLRNEDGSVILYNANRTTAHRFGPRGENLGPVSRIGQGPGEFRRGVKPLVFGRQNVYCLGKKTHRIRSLRKNDFGAARLARGPSS